MRKIDLELTLLSSIFAVCALISSCTDESMDEAQGSAFVGATAGARSDAMPARTGAAGQSTAGSSSMRAEPATATAGSGGASASGSGAGGAKAASPAQEAPTQSPTPQPAMQKAMAGAGGSAGSKAPASGSGGAAGAASTERPWENMPVIPKSTTPTPADLGIETVMMDVAYVAGVNGSVNPEPRPIIMFTDGWACRDMNFVVKELSADEHRAQYPKDWLQWKVVDGKVALQKGMNWEKMSFQLKYPPNNVGLAFDKTFTHSSGLTLGNTTAFVKKSVRFTSDHKVVWGSEPAAADHRGTYYVDDYTITFKWDDGSETRTSFVWSSEDPAAVYIDGAAFVTRD